MDEIMEYKQWIEYLEEKAEKLPRIQARLMNSEVLPRLGKLLDEKSSSCYECNVYWKELQQSTMHLDQFFDDGNNFAKEFDITVSRIMRHLKLEHKIRPKGLMLSIYTAVGMVFGVVIAFLLIMFENSFPAKGVIILGWLIGTIGGWIWGKIIEGKLRLKSKLF